MPSWTQADIPDQTGRVVVITGASSGIGEVAAGALARKGATVVLAVRDPTRGEATRARIASRSPAGRLIVASLDLADLAGVRRFASTMLADQPRIDVLLNNAGLGLQSKRAITADGFERMFATNHLGHFALTGLLMPALLAAPSPRVVTISSIAHRRGRIEFADLQSSRAYKGGVAYGQSKLANLMFALELDRRARAANSRLVSVAAHPGVAATGFIAATGAPALLARLANLAIATFSQNAVHGARPGLYAATMPDVQGGQYWGPDGFREIRGTPARAAIAPQALDEAAREQLWTVSTELTGVEYPALG